MKTFGTEILLVIDFWSSLRRKKQDFNNNKSHLQLNKSDIRKEFFCEELFQKICEEFFEECLRNFQILENKGKK